MIQLPQLVILYGPPGSGKGTQATLLADKHGYQFLDWGHAFRQFAQQFRHDANNQHYQRACQVHDALTHGLPILTEDLLFIIGKQITDLISSGKKVVMDKPGSLPPESEWISSMIQDQNIDCTFVHLPLDIEVSVARILHRYYVPGSKFPYPSRQAALQDCSPGVEPIMRSDDADQEVTRNRYFNLYGQHQQEIRQIYQSKNIRMVEVNAQAEVDDVHTAIVQALTTAS